MHKVNLFECELDEHEERGAIANRGATIGRKLGAQRIGASVYEIDAGRSVWPYHYHHGVEEWLYVVSGSPTLRDLAGERTLCAGDTVCFPSGHTGAHTLAGPGRVVVFSLGGWPSASVCVYPDSDKIGPRPGDSGVPGLDNLDFRRQDAVDYWYGEGSDEPVPSPELVRPPLPTHGPPILNVMNIPAPPPGYDDQPDGFRRRFARLGQRLGAQWLGATLLEIDPGQGGAPYHCEHGREEWLLVLAGIITVRHPEGVEGMIPGDIACFPDGPAGARRLTNQWSGTARGVVFSTQEIPSVREYLELRKMMVRYSADHDAAVYPMTAGEDAIYWQGGLV
jgi:uncharacterized cupin superfamily protein